MDNINLDSIIARIKSGKIRISDHADEEANNDNLSYDETFTRFLMEKLLKNIWAINPFRAV